MNSLMLNAILAMDSYNRGYNPGIRFGNLPGNQSEALGVQLGEVTIIADSRTLLDSNDERLDIPSGFYGIAYQLSGGEIVISYRGTDDVDGIPNPFTDLDVWHGWSLGTGQTGSEQGQMAMEFYQEIAGIGNWLTANISLICHLLDMAAAANDNNHSGCLVEMKKAA